MMRRLPALITVFLLLAGWAFAFDAEQAKKDYSGADFKISSIKEILYENAPAIGISFTCPLLKERIKSHHAQLNGGDYEQWIISEDRTQLIFPFVEPERNYIVSISSEIRDINGQKLNIPARKKVKTKKLQPSVNFSSSGHIISSSGSGTLPVTTLNIDEVDIDFFAIRDGAIPEFLDRCGRNGSKSIYNLKEINRHGELVHSGRFELKPRKNQRTEYNINLEEIEALKRPGIYAAVMKKPGVYEYNYEYSYFMNTDIGLHVRKYEKKFDVYAQNISTGEAIRDAGIYIVNRAGKTLKEEFTDENGKAGFFNRSDQKYIIARVKNQVSVLALNRNALDLSGLKNAKTSHSQYQIFSFGPRNLYRPSEKVEVNILVRDFDGKQAPSMPLRYNLYNPGGGRVASGNIQPSEPGFYEFEFQTNKNSQTGQYNLRLSFAGNSNTSSYYFKIEEFLPERLNLELFDGDRDKERITGKKDTIEVPVKSSYLYGAPSSGNKVDGFVVASVNSHPFKKLKTFYFGDKKERIGYSRRNFKEIILSNEGTGKLLIENKWKNIKSPVGLNISASVYETGGRPVTRRASLTLLNGERFIGIEPQFRGDPDSNTSVEVKTGCADRNGEWIKNKKLDITLIRQDRNWYWTYNSTRGWHWAWNETPQVVFSKSIYTGDTGTALLSLPLKWGNYRLEVSDGTALTAYEFETSWSWWGNSDQETSRKPDLISLGFEKGEYRPGETARLRINPPHDGLALITVETSEGVLFTGYAPVKSKGSIVDIATDASWNRHDIYASVMVVRPGDKKDTPVPSRSFGMVHFPLKRENTKINVKIEAPEKTEPNKKVSAKIRLEGAGPLPENLRVVVSLVDVGILNITRYKTPDPESYFFGPRRYNIDLYDNYGEIIDNIGPQFAIQRFGGGFTESDADVARGGDKPKSEVMMVSFFSKPLAPDADGVVETGFDLPDFNGKLRWAAVVFGDGEYGSSDFDTKVADKVVTQISMPRFLAPGDKSTIALDLRNMSGEAGKLSVNVGFSGAVSGTGETKTIDLDDKEKKTLRFPVEAVAASGQGIIKLGLTGRDIDIKREWKLGVRSPYPSVTRKLFKMIRPGEFFEPDIQTGDLLPETVAFQMNLSNMPPIDFGGHFAYLLHYPYGCLEQSISSGYPWIIATKEAVADFGLTPYIKERFGRNPDDKFRMEQIEKAVGLVLDRQKANGSFGLWSSTSPEEKWLTVYAAEFLNDAGKAGAKISKNAIDKVNSRLRKYVRGTFSKSDHRWSDDINHYEFAFRSYAGYVLAKQGKANLTDLRRLYNQFMGKTGDDCLSWMYMAAAFKMAGDYKKTMSAYSFAVKETTREERRYYGEYGSNIRDLAGMIQVALESGYNLDEEAVFDLSDAIKDREWLSTQERICLFRTAIAMESNKSDTWGVKLFVNSIEQNLKRSKAFNTIFDLDKFKNFDGIKAENDNIYMNLTLVGEPIDPPKPQSNGLTIKRSFFDTNGRPLVMDQMKTGELALVKLDVTTTGRTPDGLVIDLLPAGLEIENQNLGNSSVNIGDIKTDGKTVSSLQKKEYIKHQEFRDDRYVAAVDITEHRGVTLFYLVRAVTPGTYKFPCSYVEDMYRPYRFAIGETPKEIEIFD